MGTRLIIEGNAVYEIDDECRTCGQKYSSQNLQEEGKERPVSDRRIESGTEKTPE